MSTQSVIRTHQILNWSKVLILGSIGNTVVGGLTGFIGSLCLQHHPLVAISIVWIGALAGFIAGLLHAFVVFSTSHLTTTNTISTKKSNKTLSQQILFIFTQAPLWSTIGAIISYKVLVGNPFDFNHPSTNPLSFLLVWYTALLGTFLIGFYSILMFWFTRSDSHLWILQNGLVLLYNKFIEPLDDYQYVNLGLSDAEFDDLKVSVIST